jgi:hypothetical protein
LSNARQFTGRGGDRDVAESVFPAIVVPVTLHRLAPTIRALSLALAMATGAQATLWVSPAGDDRNPGTEEQPFRTIEHARDAVRAMNRDMADDITVFIGGEYHLDRPIEFGPEDSGTNGFNIVYTAAPGEHPVLSGGLRVSGWSLADKAHNLWSAPAPAGLVNTHDLFVNGAPAARTRGRLLAVFTKDSAAGPDTAPDPKAQWKNPDDVVFEASRANAIWSERTGTSPAFVENAFELLGVPGEWYFDRPARRIYYTPRAGEDLASADVEAAPAEGLIAGIGTKDRPIGGLVFKGIRFEYTGFLEAPDDEPTVVAPVRPPGAVHFAHAARIQFLEDDFLHMDTPALELSQGIADCKVEGCLFGDIAWSAIQLVDASGVSISESRFSYVAAGHILEPAIGVDHAGDVAIEHIQLDHYPTAGIATRGTKPGAVREASDLVGAPMIGLHGAAPAGPEARPAADSGISQDYRELAAEQFSSPSVPRPPTDVSAEGEDQFALVTWFPSPLDGGSPVHSYTVVSSTGEKVTVSSSEFQEKGYVEVNGLPNGHPVNFTVTSANALGASAPSLASADITPWHKRKLKAPAPPASATVATGKSRTGIEITPPTSNGGSPVLSYQVSVGQAAPPLAIEGLDVINSDALHPVQRTLAGVPLAPGTAVSVGAANCAGASKPAIIILK